MIMHFYDRMRSVCCTNKNQIDSQLVFVFLPITQQEQLMGWHLSGVTRIKI